LCRCRVVAASAETIRQPTTSGAAAPVRRSLAGGTGSADLTRRANHHPSNAGRRRRRADLHHADSCLLAAPQNRESWIQAAFHPPNPTTRRPDRPRQPGDGPRSTQPQYVGSTHPEQADYLSCSAAFCPLSQLRVAGPPRLRNRGRRLRRPRPDPDPDRSLGPRPAHCVSPWTTGASPYGGPAPSAP
jgi:hypothetical protein